MTALRRPNLALLVLAACLAGCARSDGVDAPSSIAAGPTSEAVFGEVGDFAFTERRGGTVTPADLAGEPWLAAFVFTRCSTICPTLMIELGRAREALAETDARIVAFSVDPEHDTPEVLTRFAEGYRGTESARWLFLTGDEEATYALIRGSFQLAVERQADVDPGMAVSHSSRLVAVDAEGRIRGWYDASSDDGTERAIARVKYLAGDRSALSPLPKLNATLNGTAAVLLVIGWLLIRAGRRTAHGWTMRAAFLVSAAFLASYLWYHFVVVPAQGGPVRFDGEGTARTAYFVLLLTHVVGAVVNLPMVLRTLWLAHHERWEDHRRLARKTFPLWLYVSVTGVAVYFALY